jgi:hypothetical protein
MCLIVWAAFRFIRGRRTFASKRRRFAVSSPSARSPSFDRMRAQRHEPEKMSVWH